MLSKLTFSFDYFTPKCLTNKIGGENFTNKISEKEKGTFFAYILSTLKVYSNHTIVELGQQGV